MISEETKKSIKENTTKVIMNVPNELDDAYKILARRRGITKTSMIMYAMSWFLDYNKSLDLVPKMLQTLNNSQKDEIRVLSKYQHYMEE